MTHTDVATFLADKAVVQRVGFTTHTLLRCVLDLKIIPKADSVGELLLVEDVAEGLQR